MKDFKMFLQVLLLALVTPSRILGTKIGIFHWNDINGQVQQIQGGFDPASESIPKPCDKSPFTNCEGGINNLFHQMLTSPHSGVNETVVGISTGNLVGGENGWLSVIGINNGWTEYGSLVKKYYGDPTYANVPRFIHTYGLKEFESGLSRTMDYHRQHNESITLANVVCPPTGGGAGQVERDFCGIRTSAVDLLTGGSVGVVGFINPLVAKLSSPGALQFEDVLTSLRNVANSQAQYKSLIAIGDGSLDLAKQILDSVPKVKLVIYGRGFGPSRNMSGEYPMRYGSGWIATAGRYGTSLGKLVIEVDDATGVISNVNGTLLRTTYSDSSRNITEVDSWSATVTQMEGKPVGEAVFKLEGGSQCWRDECNLGNLVADAMVHCAYSNSKVTDSLRNNKPIVGVWHGGALLDDTVNPNHTISEMDVHRWLPYHNRAHFVKISGSNLKAMFELSSSGITANQNDAVQDWGQFLQVSNGLEVYYKTEGVSSRVERIRILDVQENRPIMKDVVDEDIYNLVIPTFIREGRNVYGMATNWWIGPMDLGFDDECLKNYITGLQKVTVGFEERIYINDWPGSCSPSTTIKKGGNTTLTVILTIVFMCLILGIAYVGYFYVYPKLSGRHPNNHQNFRNFQE